MIAAEVTAVVLCWNDEERVRVLLEALAAQQPGPGRIVVVDNGSAGGAASRLANAFPHCRVIALPKNEGFAAAVNRGIGDAKEHGAKWVWLLNCDLVLPAGALGSLLAAAGADARCGMAGAVLRNADGSVQAWGGGQVNLWTGMVRHCASKSSRRDYLSGACLLLRMEMLEETGSLDQRYFFSFEDVDLAFRARDLGWRLVVAEDCPVIHEEAASLGAWSEQRWFHLFAGLARLLASRSPAARLALGLRLARHTAAMLAQGRTDAIVGAWRGAASADWDPR